MRSKTPQFDEALKRAEKGGFKEYWLQQYIKNNYKKLGFSSIKGPFDTGYDFTGVYKGKKVVIEAETSCENFIYHKHNPNEVDVIVVLNDECNKIVRCMKPQEWTKLLPKKIIKVDADDFIKSTHEMRRAYAIKKQENERRLVSQFPLIGIKIALESLWNLLGGGVVYEGTPESEAFEKALRYTVADYVLLYNIRPKKVTTHSVQFTRIELLANDLIKSHRQYDDLSDEEKDYIQLWLSILHGYYSEYL